MASVIALMGLAISAPDHTAISRRAVTLPAAHAKRVPQGPLQVLIGSTGLQVYGAGQWLEAKHGAKSRRTWRKLHLAVDAASCMIVVQTLIDQDVDDPSQVVSLPDQIEGEFAKVMADGAYDGAPTYETIAAHGDEIEVVIPPRSTAAPSGATGSAHAARSSCGWQAATGYGTLSADPGAGVAQPPSTRRAVLQRKQYDGRLRGSHGDRAGRSP